MMASIGQIIEARQQIVAKIISRLVLLSKEYHYMSETE